MSTQNEIFVYRTDENDEICYTSPNWDSFAVENEGQESTSAQVLGKKIWLYISSMEVRYLYQHLVRKVSETGKPVTIPVNCDSPSMTREMLLTIDKLPGKGIEYRCTLIKLSKREEIDLLKKEMPRDGTFIRMCSYCKAIAVSDAIWLPTEKAIAELNLLNRTPLPGISHGICPDCYEKIMDEDEE